MSRRSLAALLVSAIVLTACAGSAPPPQVAPQGDDRFLLDPRSGYSGPTSEATETRLQAAWSFLLAGQYDEATLRLAELRRRTPDYTPALLAEAAIDLRQGRIDAASSTVSRILQTTPDYLAAQVLQAEIATAERRLRAAYDLYRAIGRRTGAPAATAQRLAELEKALFEELFTAAQSAPDAEAIRLLTEALTYLPGATPARLMLAQKLVATRSFEEARRVLDPLVNSGDVDRTEVQQTLAEIDAGRGRYQEAIVRYERLVRRDPGFTPRLEEIKQLWSAANMPAHYLRALESNDLTRADFAILLYWKVTSVRFAQNLPTPSIAIDVEGIAGREEIIRALALGLYEVDPVTRRVSPLRPLSTATLARLTSRLLALRGASCARVPNDQILAACAVTDPVNVMGAEVPVTGRTAAAMLDQVEKALSR